MKLGRLLMVLVLFKLAYFTIMLSALLLFGRLSVSELVQAMNRGPEDGKPRIFATWDAGWYLKLSKIGYNSGDPGCAFYPLWPFLVRWCSVITGNNLIVAGMLLSNLFSLVGWAFFFEIVRKRLGERVAWLALSSLLLFPGALFFQFIYSESLFFLLLMLLCWSMEDRSLRIAFVAALLLPLTRAIGVFSLFPIFIHILIQYPISPLTKMARKYRWSHAAIQWLEKERTRITSRQSQAFNRCKVIWLVLAPLYGYACYFALMNIWTGNPFEGFQAQKHWGVQSIGNLFNLPKFVIGLFSPNAWHEFKGSVLDRCMFLISLCALPVLWRLDKEWFAWMLVLSVIPALSGTFTSYTRFAAVAFPQFIAFSVMMREPKYRWLSIALLALFFQLHGILLWRFVNFEWAG